MVTALNFGQSRSSSPSTARRPSAAARGRNVNVSDTERLVSVLGGAGLALFGLTRGNLPGLVLGALGGMLIHRGASGHCMLYSALGFNTSDQPGPATAVEAGEGYKVEESIVVNASPEKLFQYWRKLDNLPKIMRHVKEVRMLGGNRSHWSVSGPLGISAEWDAEIHNERTNEMIAWRSLEGSSVDTAGSVHFERTGNGTRLTVILKYDPPAGMIGAAVAKLFGADPQTEIREDLQRFKETMESGQRSPAKAGAH